MLRGGIRGLGDPKLVRLNGTLGGADDGQGPETGPVALTGSNGELPGDSAANEGPWPFGPALVGSIEARRPYGSLYPGGCTGALLAVLCGTVVMIALASLVTTSRSTATGASATGARHPRRALVGSGTGAVESDLEYVFMPDQERQGQRAQPQLWKLSSGAE